ncbi:hypothetical protein O181_075726 [Austropuccinia psidii MF-1]|uniref:Uncharacterized protein n=1 Tax=Austropuccinia psidii MF-1 TaxID=1389203 RepID=A0A9Q3F924_9BASI|nr:hypothetical protein [Austropuccinia psidii MF-1]
MNSWNILKIFFWEEEIVKYSNGWNTLSSKPQIKNIKELNKKKMEESKEEAQVAFTRKPQGNKPPQEGKKNWKKPYFPSDRIARIQNNCMENVFKMTRIFMEFKDKEEKRIRQISFSNNSICLLKL